MLNFPKPVFIAVALVFAALPARPEAIISGTLSTGYGVPHVLHLFTSSGWELTGGVQADTARGCQLCLVGDIKDPDLDDGGNPLSSYVRIDNANYSLGSLFIDAMPVVINGPGIYTGTFTFDGKFCPVISSGIYCSPPGFWPWLPYRPLTGMGSYTMDMRKRPDDDVFEMYSITYSFEVPEPRTSVSLALGLAIIAWLSHSPSRAARRPSNGPMRG